MSNQKSAYSFVPAPLESQVFLPHWSGQVSHDIPFENAQSGEIRVLIKTISPLFIRHSSVKNEKSFEFSHHVMNGEKKYFIPATSLKGMIRSALEVMTFSRLNPQLVNDGRFGYRDLTKDSEYLKNYQSNQVRAGWLHEDEDGIWSVSECDYVFINHEEVDRMLGTQFRRDFLGKQPKGKSAKFKYDEVKGKELTGYFDTVIVGEKTSRKVALLDPNGKPGKIVFTGQPGPRNEEGNKSGKVNEFVFFEGQKAIWEVSSRQQHDFRFLYAEHDPNAISPDWHFWKLKLNKGERVPIFFNVSKDGKQLLHFGLSYMYKLPYQNSIHEMLPISNYREEGIDFANLLFGYTNENDSLKGRIFFSHAFTTNPSFIGEQREILGGPKASFTPYYLERNGNYNNSRHSLKGFKRYPVHGQVKHPNYDANQQNDKVFSKFIPMADGVLFEGIVRYFNLLPEELGALISALSFHGNSDGLYHRLGGAKALGYGTVKIEVQDLNKYRQSLQSFEYLMDMHCKKVFSSSWLKTSIMANLFSMSSKPHTVELDESLVAPKLKNEQGKNEFIEIKKSSNGFLRDYKDINPVAAPESILNAEFISEMNVAIQKREEEIRIAQELKRSKQLEFEDAAKKCLLKGDEKGARENFARFLELKDGIVEYDIEQKILTGISKYNEDKLYADLLDNQDVAGMEDFLREYPLSEWTESIRRFISSAKASQGVPQRIMELSEADKFFKESDQWISKLPNKTLLGSGFEEQWCNKVKALKEFNDKSSKPNQKWMNGVYQKKLISIVGEIWVNKIWSK
jgi:CRISPR-associated protein (TIGR03986 family)